jgi:tyrosyl-tRNA synthetase
MKNAKEQFDIIKRGTVHLVPEDLLMRKLERSIKKNKPLKVKYGADPSAPDLHLGHAVCFRKLKEFQDLGHQVIFVIGDFTARIGDPTGKSETRKPLSKGQVKENAKTYMEQVYLLLDREKTRVVYNNDWLGKLCMAEILRLTSAFTVARMLERDDFSKRFKSETAIGVHEFLYPVMVAYDSVHLEADVEMGGSDQYFNFLAGRELMQELGQEPQVCLTMPILTGTDGVQKMSKSLGNYIAIKDSPSEMFGKTMSIPDSSIRDYAMLAAFYDDGQLKSLEERLKSENPRNVKAEVARDIVAVYHGKEKAERAEEEFARIFSKKGLPDEIPRHSFAGTRIWIVKALVETGIAKTNSEARRLIKQGAVYIDDRKVTDENEEVGLEEDTLIKAGRFFRKIGK